MPSLSIDSEEAFELACSDSDLLDEDEDTGFFFFGFFFLTSGIDWIVEFEVGLKTELADELESDESLDPELELALTRDSFLAFFCSTFFCDFVFGGDLASFYSLTFISSISSSPPSSP